MPIRLSLPVSVHLETTQTGTPEYDDDGNMIRLSADSAVMTYNAENRLSSVEYKILAGDVNGDGETNLSDAVSALQVVAGAGTTGTADGDINGDYRIGIEEAVYCLRVAAGLEYPVVTERKLVFTYDYMGRRVRKAVYSGNADTPGRTVLFVWNGWNMVEEITGQGGTENSRYFVWGLDLSQSFNGAGGIGGLLCAVNGDAAYCYLYDGNGNAGQVVNAGNGAVAAHYEYDPFGNLTAKSGLYADANPFRFSTKYLDAETGLYYYGYRYYSPEIGRWINRDPIGEYGGMNLYAFVLNNPNNSRDLLGLILQTGDKLEVKCGGFLGFFAEKGGEITIQAYNKIITPVRGGAEMKARFDESNLCCCPGSDYRWIQIVTKDTSPGQPQTPYRDPQPPDDLLPYYWTNSELTKYSGSGYLEFNDPPADPSSSLTHPNTPTTWWGLGTTKVVTVKFTTYLVCSSQYDKILGYFKWGFEYYREKNGTIGVELL